MAEVAAKWAAQCALGHDDISDRAMPDLPGVGIGQNMAAGNHGLMGAINMWAGEKPDFLYGTETSATVGHYTQMVNAATARVGCGVAECPHSVYKQFQVCNYATKQTSSSLTTPYTMSSDSCSDCSDACDDTGTLCDYGNALCYNNGLFDVSTASCRCFSPYDGQLCQDVACVADASFCPLYQQYYGDDVCSRYAVVKTQCPNMCGIC